MNKIVQITSRTRKHLGPRGYYKYKNEVRKRFLYKWLETKYPEKDNLFILAYDKKLDDMDSLKKITVCKGVRISDIK